MAECWFCHREMTTADSCSDQHLTADGMRYEMVRFGEEEDWTAPEESARCGDCGVVPGGIHHPNCDIQQCPLCHGQLGLCGHEFDEVPERFS